MKQASCFLIALKSILLTHTFLLTPILNGEEDYQKYAMFGKTAKRAEATDPTNALAPQVEQGHPDRFSRQHPVRPDA